MASNTYYYGSSYHSTATIQLPNGWKIEAGPCSVMTRRPCVALNGSECSVSVDIVDYSVEPLHAFKFAVKAIARLLPRYREIGVCCSAGCGRTGTAVITYLVLYAGMEAHEAAKLFKHERGCGPESIEQWLLIARAEQLRRQGLRGDEALEKLGLPEAVDLEYVRIAPGASSITLDEIAVLPTYYELLADDVITLAEELGEKIEVPVEYLDLAIAIEERLTGKPVDAEAVKKLRDLVLLAEEIRTAHATAATRKGEKNSEKDAKTRKKSSSCYDDYYDRSRCYDELYDY